MFSVEEAPSVLRANMAVPGRNPCHIPSKAVLKDELEKLKNMLNTVKALIARGKKYRDKLSKVIKDGHQKLMDLSEKLRVCTHFLFIPQQMGEYILGEGKQVFHYEGISCGPSNTAMILSDVDQFYSTEKGVRKVKRQYRMIGKATDDAENVRVLNLLQKIISYKYRRLKKSQLYDQLRNRKVMYQGMEVALAVHVISRDSSCREDNHSLTIDFMDDSDNVFIRDTYGEQSFFLTFDDIAEVCSGYCTYPHKILDQDS